MTTHRLPLAGVVTTTAPARLGASVAAIGRAAAGDDRNRRPRRRKRRGMSGTTPRDAEGLRTITAIDLMNPEVLTVSEDMTVQELAAFLQENEISGAPVEDRNGRLVGVVSVVDVARAASFEGYLRLAAPDYFGRPAKTHEREENVEEAVDVGEIEGLSLRVADIMTPALYSVEEDTPVSSIADVMLHGHLHRVLVLRGQKLVGIVTSSDLLGLLVGE